MRGFLDRDFIRTVEGFLFCVVGGVHPSDKVISYLKYLPNSSGKWGRDLDRYSRTMPDYTIPSLLLNINMLSKTFPQYVFDSRVYHIRISAVPKRYISEHSRPEEKLSELFKQKKRDLLQEKSVQLIKYLSQKAGIPEDCFGITGSILLNIHNSGFSDMDLIIYGCENGQKVKNCLQEGFETRGAIIKKYVGIDLAVILDKWSRKYHLTIDEAKEFYKRRWNYGSFRGTPFSIHPVKLRNEITERYGSRVFMPQGIVEGRAKIAEVSDSLFLPASYFVEEFELFGQMANVEIDELVSYDGFYIGILDVGDEVKVKGKLEKVFDKYSEKTSYRVLVGSPEAKGDDYIKPLQSHP